jgi:ferritin-like metal-binding protein YciE
MSLSSLQDLMVENLKDLYNAEKQILGALPRLAKAATSPDLRQALEDHREKTEGHVARLEQAFDLLGLPAKGKLCKGMEGLIAEGRELLEEDGEQAVKDAGIIAAAQKVEHYEMSGYGTVIAYAELLGQEELAELLGPTLDEEKEADETLSTIAEGKVNRAAIDGAGEMENGKASTAGAKSSTGAKRSARQH